MKAYVVSHDALSTREIREVEGDLLNPGIPGVFVVKREGELTQYAYAPGSEPKPNLNASTNAPFPVFFFEKRAAIDYLLIAVTDRRTSLRRQTEALQRFVPHVVSSNVLY